jgi:hypothetical protein
VIAAALVTTLSIGGWLLVQWNQSSALCTLIGGSDRLAIEVGQPIRDQVATFRVQMRQGDRRAQVDFPARSQSKDGMYVHPGIRLFDGRGAAESFYSIGLAGAPRAGALTAKWDREDRVAVDLDAFLADGRPAYRRTETFRFDLTYPNGKECDEVPNFGHRTRLAESDAVPTQPAQARN